jgi:hypothetical protein
VDLHGHEAGNGGYSQRKPKAYRLSSTRTAASFEARFRATVLPDKRKQGADSEAPTDERVGNG